MRKIFFNDPSFNIHSIKVVIKRKNDVGIVLIDYDFFIKRHKSHRDVKRKRMYVPLDNLLKELNHHERGV